MAAWATVVALPMPELYQALQRGVVNGGVFPMESNKGWKLAEVVNRAIICYPTAYSLGFFVTMNKGKWNALPKDVQEIIIQINKEWIPKHGAAWDESDKVGREFMLKKGRTFIKLSPEEAARWKKATDPVLAFYVKETTPKGVPAQEALVFTQKKLAELSK